MIATFFPFLDFEGEGIKNSLLVADLFRKDGRVEPALGRVVGPADVDVEHGVLDELGPDPLSRR